MLAYKKLNMSVKFAYFLVFTQLKIVWFIQWFAFKEIGIRIVYSIKLKHLIFRTWCFQFHGWKSDLFTVNILWKECNNSSCDFFQSFELLLCIPLRFLTIWRLLLQKMQEFCLSCAEPFHLSLIAFGIFYRYFLHRSQNALWPVVYTSGRERYVWQKQHIGLLQSRQFGLWWRKFWG